MLKAVTVSLGCNSTLDHVANVGTSEASLAAGYVPIMGLNFAAAAVTSLLLSGGSSGINLAAVGEVKEQQAGD